MIRHQPNRAALLTLFLGIGIGLGACGKEKKEPAKKANDETETVPDMPPDEKVQGPSKDPPAKKPEDEGDDFVDGDEIADDDDQKKENEEDKKPAVAEDPLAKILAVLTGGGAGLDPSVIQSLLTGNGASAGGLQGLLGNLQNTNDSSVSQGEVP